MEHPTSDPGTAGVVPDRQVTELSDRDLAGLLDACVAEQHDRALARGDTEAITETAFSECFDSKGRALGPGIRSGFLVCAGSVLVRSASSHDCVFANVDGHWVWEHPEVVSDDVRRGGARSHENQRSVTLLVATEGLCVDLVTSTMRSGSHQAKRTVSYRVSGGELTVVRTRARRSPSH